MHDIFKKIHGLGTAEAALGRVGRVGVSEHDSGVLRQEVHLTARYRDNGSFVLSIKS